MRDRKFDVVAVVLVTLGLLFALTASAHAQTVPQIVNDKDTIGAFAQVGPGYTAALLTKDRSGLPYVTIHSPAGTKHGSVPPIAIIVEDGKLRVQLSDGKWSTNLPIEAVIKAVKEATEESPFKQAAWGRGGCSSCAGGNCQAEAPVVATMPDQPKHTAKWFVPRDKSIPPILLSIDGKCAPCEKSDQGVSVCPSCPAQRVARAAVTVAKAPIVAVELSRERTIERRAYRGRWVPGLWIRLGRM